MAVLGLAFALSSPSLGQVVTVDVGPRLGVDTADIDEVFLGVDGRIGLPTLPVILNPAFDYYFTDSGINFYQFSANALLDITSGVLPNISPYVGAGLGISSISVEVDIEFGSFGGDDTDIGINLLAGGSIEAGGFRPFAQVQFTIGAPDLFTVTLGTLFRVSG